MCPPDLPPRFQIVAKLGQGGMATVYLARDLTAHNQVALKVLFPHLRDDELVVERFRREIAAVRRIGHKNVISIFDLIETERLLCLVLEHHPGLDLKQLIRRRGPLPQAEVVCIADQVLQGLAVAHQQGVVHRDIKPHNILVSDDGVARIADFGLARVDDLLGVTTHTMTLGTPEYLPPELLSSPVVDGRADIYSLGVTLFEALTGRLPFRASSPMLLLRMHQEERVPDPRSILEDLDEHLCQVIQRAMAKDPLERFATAEQMRQALLNPQTLQLLAATVEEAHCGNCDAPQVPGLPVCSECGHELLQIATVDRGGYRVFLPRRHSWTVASRSYGDDLTFEQKHRLIQEVEAAAGEVQLKDKKLDRRLRQLPVVVADHLDQESARLLGKQLELAGLPVKVRRRGLWGGVAHFLRFMRLPTAAGIGFVTLVVTWLLTMIVDPGPPVVASFAGLIGFVLGLVLDTRWRSLPLALYRGERGHRLAQDALLQRVGETLPQLRSSRLRSLVRKLLLRGLELRTRLERNPQLRPELAAELEQLLTLVLVTAQRSGALESELALLDAAEICEQIKVVDEKISQEQTVDRTQDLIDQKARLKNLLGELDDKQQEQARLVGRLLDVAAQLATLSTQLSALERDKDGDNIDGDISSISVMLRQLNAEIEGHLDLK